MAASALNIGDFGPHDTLQVEQMLEPIIMGPDGLKKQGTVMLRKVTAELSLNLGDVKGQAAAV
jgi:hypothetical protein